MGKKFNIDASFNNAFTSQKERYKELCRIRKHPRSPIIDVIIITVDKRIQGRVLARMTESEAEMINNDLERLQAAIDVFDESTK